MRFKQGVRVLDYDPETRELKTLFHGVNGSRVLPRGKFIKAEKKLVQDGKSTKYMSGFHVFTDVETCLKYARKFGKRDQRVVVDVDFVGNRQKAHSKSGVILADKMRIPNLGGMVTLATLLNER